MSEPRPETRQWRYEIQHGPDGEADYAWVYFGGEMIATMKTHHAVAFVASSEALQALREENKRLRAERYRLAYAITGGEDAPGLLDTVSVEELERIQRNSVMSHNYDIDLATAAEARLEEALKVIEPFAKEAEQIGIGWGNERRMVTLSWKCDLTVGHLRAARRFMEESHG